MQFAREVWRSVDARCPSCNAEPLSVFYEISGVPVHSMLLIEQKEEALCCQRGDISLAVCPSCGFIANLAFDSSLLQYSEKYEASQGYSPTFDAFHRRLATDLIARYGLRSKRIVEIGCGQGEFLSLLCDLGDNQGLGFDPSYSPDRVSHRQPSGVRIVRDFFSDRYPLQHADFVCCKMTLEHIPNVASFLTTVRRALDQVQDAVVFFQVPNGRRIFADAAFWDVYYEHCSYFTAGSLARLFRACGFSVDHLWTGYHDQYLMVECRCSAEPSCSPLASEDEPADLVRILRRFAAESPRRRALWRQLIRSLTDNGRRVVVWGGGSKAVSFLNTLGIKSKAIGYAVDINPHKQGKYIAGMGQLIVAPAFLKDYRPDVIIVMNSVYVPEIASCLAAMDLYPTLLPVEAGVEVTTN